MDGTLSSPAGAGSTIPIDVGVSTPWGVLIVLIIMHGCSRVTRLSHPYNVGTEHVGFSSIRQTSLEPSAKRREVFVESYEGCAASY